MIYVDTGDTDIVLAPCRDAQSGKLRIVHLSKLEIGKREFDNIQQLHSHLDKMVQAGLIESYKDV